MVSMGGFRMPEDGGLPRTKTKAPTQKQEDAEDKVYLFLIFFKTFLSAIFGMHVQRTACLRLILVSSLKGRVVRRSLSEAKFHQLSSLSFRLHPYRSSSTYDGAVS